MDTHYNDTASKQSKYIMSVWR